MEEHLTVNYDIIVVGAGHAGIEAAAAAARLGAKTLLLALNLDSVGFLACNPSIGGSSKGHLVKEIDALGGVMAREADKALVQLRTLHRSKGASVQSPRAQIDKNLYHRNIKHTVENIAGLTLRQGEAVRLITARGGVHGVITALGAHYLADRVILACGVYLSSTVITGAVVERKGPSGFARAEYLSASIAEAGHELRRFKTGTPARADAKSIDFARLSVQNGDSAAPLSVMTDGEINYNLMPCYLGYTNAATHDIIRNNLRRSPSYSGIIKGVGARYCPSIEDKIVRFASKSRHQFFLEPEGADTDEIYVQGLSTSLPQDIQLEFLRSVEGLGQIEIMRDAYAIEYDCIDSRSLLPTLESKIVKGLYCAGQINGTSGYEEAAAQGLIAGINAARAFLDKPPLVLKRSEAYIGVLIDDLVTKGTNEPYRMMTSRAEYRLSLRHDNADIRLTQKGFGLGLVTEEQYSRFTRRLDEIERVRARLKQTVPPAAVNIILTAAGDPEIVAGMQLEELMRRPHVTAEALRAHVPTLGEHSPSAVNEVLITIQYGGYLDRQARQISEANRLESMLIPETLDYAGIKGLRTESAQRLAKIKPLTLGQASRISGVNPADIAVLIVYIKKNRADMSL
ncbi:MAG: tRNA uridine-5-carboxymethylaminomethyl(34) synthesis enzyme MnmG [Clostridiales bacterium]|jgi:tRNA uridine 5-carboxymethylaminomethyl modification enzyme|nr:tRNA uridine-5-carboxymethylaminomethyl(34) synthesis enzyme MnmG [Clostridiales bacterium]